MEWHDRTSSKGIAEQRAVLLEQTMASAILYLDDDVVMESWVVE